MSANRFLELLPFYVNGTSSAEERDWVELYLREHPQASAQLDWHRDLQKNVRESMPEVDPTVGLDRALALISAEKTAPGRFESKRADDTARWRATTASSQRRSDSLSVRLRRWLTNANLLPVLGAACAVVVAQGVVIGTMFGQHAPAPVEYRSMGPSASASGPLVRVNFKPDSRESELRLLLVEIGGTLAGGPGQLGDWYVSIPPDSRERALATLRSHPLVEAAELVDRIPPKQ
jgi:hypothetical protein